MRAINATCPGQLCFILVPDLRSVQKQQRAYQIRHASVAAPITTTLQVAPAGRGHAGNYLQRFTPNASGSQIVSRTLDGALMASGLRNVD